MLSSAKGRGGRGACRIVEREVRVERDWLASEWKEREGM